MELDESEYANKRYPTSRRESHRLKTKGINDKRKLDYVERPPAEKPPEKLRRYNEDIDSMMTASSSIFPISDQSDPGLLLPSNSTTITASSEISLDSLPKVPTEPVEPFQFPKFDEQPLSGFAEWYNSTHFRDQPGQEEKGIPIFDLDVDESNHNGKSDVFPTYPRKPIDEVD